jgi:WD40 repeat protein
MTPDGKTLLLASSKLFMVDLPSGDVAELDGHKDGLFQVAVSFDGKYAATTSYDGSIRLWDLATRKSVVIGETDDWSRGVAISPNGQKLLTSFGGKGVEEQGIGRDRSFDLRLWDLAHATIVRGK